MIWTIGIRIFGDSDVVNKLIVRMIFETIKTPIGTKNEKQVRKHILSFEKSFKNFNRQFEFRNTNLNFLC